MSSRSFMLDGRAVPYTDGQTVMQAARAARIYIPHLCYHPEFRPQGSCKLCTVKANGRQVSACTFPAADKLIVESNTAELNQARRILLQMLFVEGNHFCPSCEKSGDCLLQATAYELEMLTPEFPQFFPNRELDASHPDMLLDLNRCILCGLCVEASKTADRKNVFVISGRGMHNHVIVNSPSGHLGDSAFSAADRAADVCPVGAILHKRRGFCTPIGCRQYDHQTVSEQVNENESE
jgi:[NiFe] hydrogenase diaphorase moiety small subunit